MTILVVGGSDAGITAGLRARQLDPTSDVHLIVADDYPNFSICGIPYHVSGEVPDWRSLAHRTTADLTNGGLQLHLSERAVAVDVDAQTVSTLTSSGEARSIGYDRLIVATGAVPNKPPITGLDHLGTNDGVHLLHTMADTFAVTQTLDRGARSAVIVGAGYIGLEMAEALRHRGLQVTVVEQLVQVLPRTLDPQLAALIHAELERNGVTVACNTAVAAVEKSGTRLRVHTAPVGQESGGTDQTLTADLVLVVTGVRPDTHLAVDAGAKTGFGGALAVDTGMRTNLPDVYAAGDCVHTHHRLLDHPTYVPLGTTAHKQGRVAGENAVGGTATFAGSLGTQVVRIFDLVAAATGLRDDEATAAGYRPLTAAAQADDHKIYYPGATPITQHVTGDTVTRKLLGAQLVGHLQGQVSKRIDILATTIFYGGTVDEIPEFDLSYTPPLGSPYDAIQNAAFAWLDTQRH
jgi:NADPH-dependent 2,4-dienoyl-CoA reductase/sulfur reductase-like enzyme